MERSQVESLLADVKRIEELAPYPVGHAAAWDEIRNRAASLRRALVIGMAADLATKLSYTVGYIVSSRDDVQEDRERGRLQDQLRRLRAELEHVLKS